MSGAPPPPAGASEAPSGLLVVDKPAGPTSHDVVAWARRALGTRAIGHTGTLDPFATGVLVLCVGEATKLAAHVMAGEKEYEATLALGAETDTLDATGAVVLRAAVPPLDADRVHQALGPFLGQVLQVPPAISAIKTGGVPSHRRARRGEAVAPAARPVECRSVEVVTVAQDAITLRVRCGPGYYVRALGRDLARALGTVGHLSALRRVRSGRYLVREALDGEDLRRARTDEAARARVRAALVPLGPESSPLPVLVVEGGTAEMLRVGKRPPAPAGAPEGEIALAFGSDGRAVAIVASAGGVLRVVRGMQ